MDATLLPTGPGDDVVAERIVDALVTMGGAVDAHPARRKDAPSRTTCGRGRISQVSHRCTAPISARLQEMQASLDKTLPAAQVGLQKQARTSPPSQTPVAHASLISLEVPDTLWTPYFTVTPGSRRREPPGRPPGAEATGPSANTVELTLTGLTNRHEVNPRRRINRELGVPVAGFSRETMPRQARSAM